MRNKWKRLLKNKRKIRKIWMSRGEKPKTYRNMRIPIRTGWRVTKKNLGIWRNSRRL